MSSRWFVASDDYARGSVPLTSTTKAVSTDLRFADAQKVTITFESAFVREDRDFGAKGDNDIIITSRHQLAARPAVERVHFYKSGVPAPDYITSAFHPVVWATNDFRTADEEIRLRIRIFDEDGLSAGDALAFRDALAGVAAAAAIAFPVFAPYAGLSAGLASAIVDLVDRLDEHDRIVEGEIRLSVNKPSDRGFNLFQPGFLVCFARETDGTNLFFDGAHVVERTPNGETAWTDGSYAVLRLRRGFVPQAHYVIDEEAATLLTELENGKGNQGVNTLRFLQETLAGYQSFRRLERAAELSKKGRLSQDEKDLLAELRSDPTLQPFLSQSSLETTP